MAEQRRRQNREAADVFARVFPICTEPLVTTKQEVRGLIPLEFRNDALRPIERDKKKYWMAFALLLFVVGIILAASFAAKKNVEDHNEDFQKKNRKHHTTHDLSAYGYPSAQGTSSSGWVTWLPGRRYKDDNPNHVSYNGTDGASSLEACASRCNETKAPTGSWSGKYKTCWCNFAAVTNFCREPCVEDEHIYFGTVPIDDIHFCRESVCDEDWPQYDEKFCRVDVGFDQNTCDAKKEEIQHASAQTSAGANN